MAKYSKKAQDLVEKTMHKKKEGKLKSGSGDKVKSRKQAVAIALSEAREKGYKVPPERSSKSSSKKSSGKKIAGTGEKTSKTSHGGGKKRSAGRSESGSGTRKTAKSKKS